MEWSLANTILLIIILFLLFRDKFRTNISDGGNNEQSGYVFDNTFSEYEKKLITKIHDKFYKYSDNLIPLDIFYSVLWTESGGQIYNGVPNNQIIGDNGKSIGFMQVNKSGALLEFNAREGKNYTADDLKNESKNIEVGRHYLFYCLNSALEMPGKKPIQWLVFKKYNGGIDETELSTNNRANAYADKTYNHWVKIKRFVELNLS